MRSPFAAMALILVTGAIVAMHAEFQGNPLFPPSVAQSGLGNDSIGGAFVSGTRGDGAEGPSAFRHRAGATR